LALVSGFVSTVLAPLAMNLAMSSGRALPVTPAAINHDGEIDEVVRQLTDDGPAVLELLPHDGRRIRAMHLQLQASNQSTLSHYNRN